MKFQSIFGNKMLKGRLLHFTLRVGQLKAQTFINLFWLLMCLIDICFQP